MQNKSKSLLDRLKTDVVLVAEGYVFELERRGYLKAGPFVPEVVLEYPAAVKELHHEFLRAGTDVVVACTYYGHRAKLKSIGLEDRLAELNTAALRIAAEAAEDFGALVAGNLSNTWEYEPGITNSAMTVRAIFDEQLGWAVQEGADFIIAETFSHLGEARLALEAIKTAELPAVITFSPATGKACDNVEWDDACKILQDEGADVVGLNCGNGPATMLPILKKIRKKTRGHIAGLPVPYRTTTTQPCFQKLRLPDSGRAFPMSLESFQLTRYDMADFAIEARDLGINYIGICCGAGPHHVRAMAEALGREPQADKYSPEMSLHPVFGDKNTKEKHVICLLGPVDE
ncbi:MAG: homocysteine S-methyltransferase family protein [Desulfobacterales bacterium]|nr:homocysteine S-methyltransferase family protein [Desulfobacterales bacterium]